jgi:hypothetical protein
VQAIAMGLAAMFSWGWQVPLFLYYPLMLVHAHAHTLGPMTSSIFVALSICFFVVDSKCNFVRIEIMRDKLRQVTDDEAGQQSDSTLTVGQTHQNLQHVARDDDRIATRGAGRDDNTNIITRYSAGDTPIDGGGGASMGGTSAVDEVPRAPWSRKASEADVVARRVGSGAMPAVMVESAVRSSMSSMNSRASWRVPDTAATRFLSDMAPSTTDGDGSDDEHEPHRTHSALSSSWDEALRSESGLCTTGWVDDVMTLLGVGSKAKYD